MTEGVLPLLCNSSFRAFAISRRRFLSETLKPVVRMLTSISPVLGSVADCFKASRCSLWKSISRFRTVFHKSNTGNILQNQSKTSLYWHLRHKDFDPVDGLFTTFFFLKGTDLWRKMKRIPGRHFKTQAEKETKRFWWNSLATPVQIFLQRNV